MVMHKEEPAMPMGDDKLSDADIAIITEWINQLTPAGTVASTGEHGPPTRQQGYAVTAKDRAFWAFVKPVRPAVPAVKQKAWVRNEIDAFVLGKLEANGLQPAAPRRTARTVCGASISI
jgi:hypothetical protein